MKSKRLLRLLTLSVLTILILGNPSEDIFLQKVSEEYGDLHGGTMSTETLSKIGTSNYQSYLLFSFYEYSFGSISVHYFGTCFLTFYRGSSTSEIETKDPELRST